MDIETTKLIIEKLGQLGQLASNTAWTWSVKMQIWYGIVSTSIVSLFILGVLTFWGVFIYNARKEKDWGASGGVFGIGGLVLVLFIVMLALECIPRIVLPEYFVLQNLISK